MEVVLWSHNRGGIKSGDSLENIMFVLCAFNIILQRHKSASFGLRMTHGSDPEEKRESVVHGTFGSRSFPAFIIVSSRGLR